MSTTQRVNVDNLGGGVNSKMLPTEIDPSQTLGNARNIRIDGNSKKPRAGYVTFANDLGTNVPRGLFGWDRDTSTNDVLALSFNQNMYLISSTGTTWGSPIETTQTVDKRATFEKYKDWLFVFNGTDESGRLSETAVTFDGTFSGGETSGTLASNWTGITGVYDVTFSNGDERPVSLTNGATTATWTLALSASATADATTIAYDEPFTKPDSLASAAVFTPSFGNFINGSLVCGGVPTAPNSWFISKPATSAAPEAVFDFSGAINAGDADEINAPSRTTAAIAFSKYGVLFTINSAVLYRGFKDLGTAQIPDIEEVKGSDGCVNQSSAVVVGNDVYYLTPRKEIRSIRKGFDESLSAIVDPINELVDKQMQELIDDSFATDSFGYYDRTNKLIKFHVRKVGSSVPDLVIVLDVEHLDKDGRPSILFDEGKSFVDGVFFENKSFTASSGIGQMFEDEVGLADYDDVAIATIWDTKQFTGGVPTLQKRYRHVSIFGQISTTTTLTVTVLVNGSAVQSVVINSNDVEANEGGGIATQTIGEHAVGDDDITSASETLQEFVKLIPFRNDGRKISIRFETDQINGNYKASHCNYDLISLSKENVKLSEVL